MQISSHSSSDSKVNGMWVRSRSWHLCLLCPWARHLTIASLHTWDKMGTWGQRWFMWLTSLECSNLQHRLYTPHELRLFKGSNNSRIYQCGQGTGKRNISKASLWTIVAIYNSKELKCAGVRLSATARSKGSAYQPLPEARGSAYQPLPEARGQTHSLAATFFF